MNAQTINRALREAHGKQVIPPLAGAVQLRTPADWQKLAIGCIQSGVALANFEDITKIDVEVIATRGEPVATGDIVLRKVLLAVAACQSQIRKLLNEGAAAVAAEKKAAEEAATQQKETPDG